jgi:hypothetical protein
MILTILFIIILIIVIVAISLEIKSRQSFKSLPPNYDLFKALHEIDKRKKKEQEHESRRKK